jgi:signal transduction histidine kinase
MLQEEERKRISRELHDDIAQTLTGINVRLASLKAGTGENSRSLRKKISNTQRLVEKSVEIVHKFARDLRPGVLDDLGLIPALHSYVKIFARQTHLLIRLRIDAGVERLEPAKRVVLYRVAQEGLTNVARHARATHVEISIEKVSDSFFMKLTDDGRSFPVEQTLHTKKNRRLGLLGMRERIEMVGGRLGIASTPGQGTTIQVVMPGLRARKCRKAD